MLRRADLLILTCGLLLSLLLHATLIVPSLIRSMRTESPDGPMHARFNPQDFEPTRVQPPPEVMLGIDAKTPSTFTWVGYEEYQEHLVALSELEQAAFTPEPALTPGEPAAAAAPAPVGEPASEAPPEAMAEAEVEAPEARVPPATVVQASLRTLRQWLEQIDLESLPDQLPDVALPSVAEEERDDGSPRPAMGDAEVETSEAPRATDPQTQESESPDEQERDSEARAATPGESTRTSAESEAKPAGSSGEPGEIADKESDPSTTIEVPLEQIRLGQPIARPGLEVKPRRPHFTLLTRLTASPGNPVVEVRFKRDGIPKSAEVVKSSGNTTVDHAVETSLYRWRASGKQLDDLGDDETLNVRIVIVLR